MKLSIIIPVYNVEKYLEECLKNIIIQINNNIQIVLVDDGSTDNSGKICDKYEEKYAQIKVIHKKNGGLSSARNEGLKYAEGEYIVFIDSDDVISKQLCGILLDVINKENPDIIEYNFEKFIDGKFNERICKKKEKTKMYEKIIGIDNVFDAYFITKKIKRESWTKAYKKALFDNINFPIGRLAEDLATTYKVLAKSNKVVYINEILYFYRVRNNSIMGNGSIKLYYDAMLAHSEIYDFIKHRDKYSRIAYTNYFNNLMKLYSKNYIEQHKYKIKDIEKRYFNISFRKLNIKGKLVFILSKFNYRFTLNVIYNLLIKGGRKD